MLKFWLAWSCAESWATWAPECDLHVVCRRQHLTASFPILRLLCSLHFLNVPRVRLRWYSSTCSVPDSALLSELCPCRAATLKPGHFHCSLHFYSHGYHKKRQIYGRAKTRKPISFISTFTTYMTLYFLPLNIIFILFYFWAYNDFFLLFPFLSSVYLIYPLLSLKFMAAFL